MLLVVFVMMVTVLLMVTVLMMVLEMMILMMAMLIVPIPCLAQYLALDTQPIRPASSNL